MQRSVSFCCVRLKINKVTITIEINFEQVNLNNVVCAVMCHYVIHLYMMPTEYNADEVVCGVWCLVSLP